MIYLDHAATTPLDARVRDALLPWLGERFGNPSSRHRAGVAAKRALDEARAQVARSVGARRGEVVFTSGGTEANDLAVLGGARAREKRGRHVLVGASEHACVRAAAALLATQGFEVETLKLTASGGLDLAAAERALRPDTVLVAQMLAQNEVGSVYPVRELARRVRARAPHALIHVDAVQALGKLELSMVELCVDTLALSAHKVRGPQGAGALVVREGVELVPLLVGGGQERGLRSGTENVAAIVGFGVAARIAEDERAANVARWSALRERLITAAREIAGVRVLEPGRLEGAMLPNLVALVVSGAPSEVHMHHLEELGVQVSAGSACQSAKAELSPTLAAIGLKDADARSLLRVSFGAETSAQDVETLIGALRTTAQKLETRRP